MKRTFTNATLVVFQVKKKYGEEKKKNLSRLPHTGTATTRTGKLSVINSFVL